MKSMHVEATATSSVFRRSQLRYALTAPALASRRWLANRVSASTCAIAPDAEVAADRPRSAGTSASRCSPSGSATGMMARQSAATCWTNAPSSVGGGSTSTGAACPPFPLGGSSPRSTHSAEKTAW